MAKEAFNMKNLFCSSMDVEMRKRSGEMLCAECSVVRMENVHFGEERGE